MTASAQTSVWSDDWRRFSAAEGIATGVGAGVGLTLLLIGERVDPLWTGELLLDLPVRRMIGAETAQGERRAAAISDGTVLTTAFAPALLGAGLVRRDGVAATQLLLLSVQSHAINFGVTSATKVLVGRSRPDRAECFARRQLDPDAECERRPTVSFFSGHASTAFTGAGLLCAFAAVPLWGEGAANYIPCAVGLSTASATGILRIMANKHHTSDVLVGAAVGLATGWGLPWLLHFRHGDAPSAETSMTMLRVGGHF